MRVTHRHAVPYSQHQNGVAERSWRTVAEKTRAIMIRAGVGEASWASVMSAVVFVMNRTYTDVIETSPYQKLHGKDPDLSRLRVIGCPVFVHEPIKGPKLRSKAVKGVLIGYSEKCNGYEVLVDGRVRTTRDLTFDESFQHQTERKRVGSSLASTQDGPELCASDTTCWCECRRF